MSTSTLTSKGQATIPSDVRKRLNLHPGDLPEFVIDQDGRVLVLPAGVDASELAGMLKRPAKTVTVAEMSQVIHKRGRAAMIGIDANVQSGIWYRMILASHTQPRGSSKRLYEGGPRVYHPHRALRTGVGPGERLWLF